jgi:hypothetical protein
VRALPTRLSRAAHLAARALHGVRRGAPSATAAALVTTTARPPAIMAAVPRSASLPAPAVSGASAPTSPVAEPPAAAPARRWRLRDAAGSLGGLLREYGAEGVGLLVPNLGGAVDIVVVRQPDGTLKSSPFYGAPRAHARNVPRGTLLAAAPRLRAQRGR